MASKDKLIRAIGQVNFGGGSTKTKINHQREARAFVKELRELGYKTAHWQNVTNKHAAAVVESWLDRGLSPATIKEYLAGTRAIAKAWGNYRITDNNKSLGVPNRHYITNQNRAIDQATYQRVINDLINGTKDEQRLAAQILLARELGLRHEESSKFIASRDVLNDGRIYIQAGTKGGRDRIIHKPNARMYAAIQFADYVAGQGKSLIPSSCREKKWNNHCYYLLAKHGITRKTAGASMHGFRHGYAHDRYQQITGFGPRCHFNTQEEFVNNARTVASDNWRQLDQQARTILKVELGHGPDRDDVVSQYLGSTNK